MVWPKSILLHNKRFIKTLLERVTKWDIIQGSKYPVLHFIFPTLAYINATSVLIVPWGMLGASKL